MSGERFNTVPKTVLKIVPKIISNCLLFEDTTFFNFLTVLFEGFFWTVFGTIFRTIFGTVLNRVPGVVILADMTR